MKRNILLAALALFLCVSARADTYFYEPPADGAEFRVPDGGKVVWIDAVSTNTAYEAALKLIRESWGTETEIDTFLRTNFTYQVVWTNWVSTNRTDYITNSPTAAIPTYLPDTMTQIITNANVVSWATTNTVPALLAVETNSVTAGTSYAAPGDKLIVQPAAPSGARVTVGVEN